MSDPLLLNAFPTGPDRVAAHHRLTRRRTVLWTVYLVLVVVPGAYAVTYGTFRPGLLAGLLHYGALAVAFLGAMYVASGVRHRRAVLDERARILDGRLEVEDRNPSRYSPASVVGDLRAGAARVERRGGGYGGRVCLVLDRADGVVVLPLTSPDERTARCAADLRALAAELSASPHAADVEAGRRVTELIPLAADEPDDVWKWRDLVAGDRPRGLADRIRAALCALGPPIAALAVLAAAQRATPPDHVGDLANEVGATFFILAGVGLVRLCYRPFRAGVGDPKAPMRQPSWQDPAAVELSTSTSAGFTGVVAGPDEPPPAGPEDALPPGPEDAPPAGDATRVRPVGVPWDALPLAVFPPGPPPPGLTWGRLAFSVPVYLVLCGGGALLLRAGITTGPGPYIVVWMIVMSLLLPGLVTFAFVSTWQAWKDGRAELWLRGSTLYLHGSYGLRTADLHDRRTSLSSRDRLPDTADLKVAVAQRRTEVDVPIADSAAGPRPEADRLLLAAVLLRSPHEAGRAAAERLLERLPHRDHADLPEVPGLRARTAAPVPGRGARLRNVLHGGVFAAGAVAVLLGAWRLAGPVGEGYGDLLGPEAFRSGVCFVAVLIAGALMRWAFLGWAGSPWARRDAAG